MKKIDFCDNWEYRVLGQNDAWTGIRLPHDAMLSEPRTLESRGEGNIGWYLGRDYEYRKVFLPEPAQKSVIEFEGVYHRAEVFLNGTKIAARPYGYTNFYVDVSDRLRFGEENELRVNAHNSDQPNSRWYSGTGLYRPVWLYTADGPYLPVNGVRITTLDHTRRSVRIKIALSEPGEVTVEIIDPEQNGMQPIAVEHVSAMTTRVSLSIYIPGGKLWSTDNPKLYVCRVRLGDDVVEETFGIRSLGWEPETGFTINGQREILRGACIHHDNGLLGACAFPEAEERKIRILKENGYNAVRSAHNPCSKAMLDACDRLGMLMLDEYVDAWYMHKTKFDYVNDLVDWWQQDLTDMVEKDYNHPSVIGYSTGNEVAETAQPKGIAFTKEMTEFLHSLDPTRPVTCGINIFFNFLSSIGLGVYSDEKAEKESKETEKKAAGGKKKKAVGSEFYNMLACKLGDRFMKFGATLYPCDLKTRDAFANMDIAGYNYGLWRYRHDLKKYPKRLILGSETFCKDAYAFYEIARDNPRIIGDFVWAGFDYIGETSLGGTEYENYRMEAPQTQMTGGGCRIDLTGKPRAEAAYTRVAFEREKGPLMAVCPVDQDKDALLNGWVLTKAVESWSWDQCKGRSAKVEVYSRDASVALLLNGKEVARKKRGKDCRILFSIPYEPGTLTAVAYDEAGREVGRYAMTSAKEAGQLRILPEEPVAKTGSLCFVRLRYTDEGGIWRPMERHRLKVAVSGGQLLAAGCGSAYIDGNFTTDTTETYYGEALAILRPDGTGDVTVSVRDETREVSCVIPLV